MADIHLVWVGKIVLIKKICKCTQQSGLRNNYANNNFKNCVTHTNIIKIVTSRPQLQKHRELIYLIYEIAV